MTWIQCVIPYEPDFKLGYACNRIMKQAAYDQWVMFLDHDATIVNPHWYNIALKGIERWGQKAGFITGVTNRLGLGIQKIPPPIDNDDIENHRKWAAHLETTMRGEFIDFSGTTLNGLSGFTILTHRKAWEDAGGFPDKFLGMDTQYTGRIRNAGYGVYIMKDWYFYHHYRRDWKAKT